MAESSLKKLHGKLDDIVIISFDGQIVEDQIFIERIICFQMVLFYVCEKPVAHGEHTAVSPVSVDAQIPSAIINCFQIAALVRSEIRGEGTVEAGVRIGILPDV